MSYKRQAEDFAQLLLIAIRKVINDSDFDLSEFPRWSRAANIRLAELNNSTIIFYERTPEDHDQIIEYREVKSDVEFVFPQRESGCESVMFDLTRDDNDEPALSSVSNLTLSISSSEQCFTNTHHSHNHLSFLFHNVVVQYEPEDQIEAVRYVPFALFVPSQHVANFDKFWSECAEQVMRAILPHEELPTVEYRSESMAEKGILSCVDDTVIILGNYDDPFEDELRQIRDYLIRLGYDAFLIKDLPAPDEMSLEEKVKLWTTASRFCIMVDRDASGHIKEYEIVKSERKPLVFLRPEDRGSTWMIGDDELVDLNYIKTFEFSGSPLGKTKEGVQWAEKLLKDRGKKYPEFYPWKSSE
ncbi:hypothetical protein [Haloferax sp. Atlit-12N]|uniref:hypothetical protein n=1 Tax=Haloferax sp. Atlit-12N TaxID=2077203 RepID=UPI0011E5ED5D|nr:hypothetical protein [Haloferax sp. Atlit-12N]